MQTLQRTRFVIVGLQRSGTTVTVGCLSEHPEIACAQDEIKASPLFTKGLATFSYGNETFDVRKRGLAALFDAISMVGASPSVRANGLKVAVNTPDEAMDLVAALREYMREVKVILIRRDDLVAQYASLLRAQTTGQWHLFKGDGVERTKGVSVHVEKELFEEYLRGCDAVMGHLETLRSTHDVADFHYERDIVPGTEYGRLFQFLGARELPVTWLRMRKVAPPPEELVDNIAEARQWLAARPAPEAAALRAAARQRQIELGQAESPFFLLDRAWNHLTQGRRDEAQVDVMTALAGDQEPHLVVQAQARLWVSVEETAEVGAEHPQLAVLRERHADNPEFLVYRAAARLDLGRASAAFADVVAALELPTELGQLQRYAFHVLEHAVAALPDRASVAADLQRLDNRLADNPDYLLFRAALKLQSGAVRDAHSDVLAALLCPSAHDDGLLGTASAMLQQAWDQAGTDDLAHHALETLAARYGNNPYYLLRRASWDRGKGRNVEAMRDCVAALATGNLEPSLERWGYELLEGVLQARNDPEAARAALEMLGADGAERPHLLVLKGLLQRSLGDADGCVACMRRVLEIVPGHERASELLRSSGH